MGRGGRYRNLHPKAPLHRGRAMSVLGQPQHHRRMPAFTGVGLVCSVWINLGGAFLREARLLCLRKLPRQASAIAAVKGHERPPAPQKNSEAFRRRSTVKSVTDPGIEACYRSMIQYA
jgi:hypothetical protein